MLKVALKVAGMQLQVQHLTEFIVVVQVQHIGTTLVKHQVQHLMIQQLQAQAVSITDTQ